jgi:hypothetical protein
MEFLAPGALMLYLDKLFWGNFELLFGEFCRVLLIRGYAFPFEKVVGL